MRIRKSKLHGISELVSVMILLATTYVIGPFGEIMVVIEMVVNE